MPLIAAKGHVCRGRILFRYQFLQVRRLKYNKHEYSEQEI